MSNINLEDAEKVVETLRHCENRACMGCPELENQYQTEDACRLEMLKIAADLMDVQAAKIIAQDTRIAELEAKLAEVTRERDAAVRDLTLLKVCLTCKREVSASVENSNVCINECINRSCWEWRGVCAENTEEADHD